MKYKTPSGDEVEGTPAEIAEFLSLNRKVPAAAPKAAKKPEIAEPTENEREDRREYQRKWRLKQKAKKARAAKATGAPIGRRAGKHFDYKPYLNGKTLTQHLDTMPDAETTEVEELVERIRAHGLPPSASTRKLKMGIKAYLYAKKRLAKKDTEKAEGTEAKEEEKTEVETPPKTEEKSHFGWLGGTLPK